jgi:hypothetical protein
MHTITRVTRKNGSCLLIGRSPAPASKPGGAPSEPAMQEPEEERTSALTFAAIFVAFVAAVATLVYFVPMIGR